jgi:glycosyltransferase involved in cell wall biosynthesis
MVNQRIAFVDHSYHQKTRSTRFIREALFPGQIVEDWWDDSWIGGTPVDTERLISQGYDQIAVCQTETVAEALARHGCERVIFIPMWDSCQHLPGDWWRALDGFRIVSFCRALHERVRRYELPSIHVEYYPDPSAVQPVADFAELRGFFWQRRHDLTWHHVLRLVGNTRFSRLHFHMTQDPSTPLAQQEARPIEVGGVEPPSPVTQERHHITLSHWFEQQCDYLGVLNGLNVCFAPRPCEGIGFSFLEAMAMGMCVVAPDAPTMNEYITDGVTGLLWNLDQPQSLDFSQAAELGRRARDKVAAGHQKWLSELPVLQEFVEVPSHRLSRLCDSLRFRGGFIASSAQCANVRHALARIAATAAGDGRATGGLRTRGFTKRDLAEPPLITIATVTLNCIDQFEGTIRNVLRQDYPNLEVIVIDGGSTDGTLDLIRRYDDYVDLWTCGEDDGPYDAMNRAAHLASGRYILFMNAGDWFLGENAISHAMRDAPAAADFIIGHHIYRQLNGGETLHKANAFETTWRHLTAGELNDFWLRGVPCHQATFTRTQLIREQHYDTRFRIAADHEFMYRQRRNGARFHHCDAVISVYASGGMSNCSRCFDDWMAIAGSYGSAEAAERYFGPARRAKIAGEGSQEECRGIAGDGSQEECRGIAGDGSQEECSDQLFAELARLRAIENSTLWRMTYPIRLALMRTPRIRRGLRAVASAPWRIGGWLRPRSRFYEFRAWLRPRSRLNELRYRLRLRTRAKAALARLTGLVGL